MAGARHRRRRSWPCGRGAQARLYDVRGAVGSSGGKDEEEGRVEGQGREVGGADGGKGSLVGAAGDEVGEETCVWMESRAPTHVGRNSVLFLNLI